MTGADNVMNLQHFGSDPVDIRIRIRINLEIRIRIQDHFRRRFVPCKHSLVCLFITTLRFLLSLHATLQRS